MEVASHAAQLLKEHELFELLPAHGKVVTLDADLPMKHALDALSSHSATCLPVWDSFQQRFVDVFTCTDLVDIVLFTHRALAASGGAAMTDEPRSAPTRGDAQQAIERCQLRDLHGLSRSKHSGFVMASVDDSMYHGCLMLKQHGLECLPLGDTSCSTALLHVLLPEQILAFIATSPAFREEGTMNPSQLFAAPLSQTALPHCPPPTTVPQGTSLSESLALLSERRLYALPIVSQDGRLHDILSCRDVRHLASTSQTDDLTTRVEECLGSLPPTPVRLHTCSPSDTLASAIERLANIEVAQLVCIDERGAVLAVLSSAEILTCLLA